MNRERKSIFHHALIRCMEYRLIKGSVLKRKRSEGFTLVEVLVVTTILSIIFTTLYGAFFSILASRSKIEHELETSREISRFAGRFSMEVKAVFLATNNAKTIFISQKRYVNARPLAQLIFTTLRYPPPEKGDCAGDVVRVSYIEEETESGKRSLYREVSNPYAEKAEKTVVRALVIEEIEGFDVSFFNGNNWTGAWDSSLDRKIPVAVKAVISLKDKGVVKDFTIVARTMIR